jgi:hypothetical protein
MNTNFFVESEMLDNEYKNETLVKFIVVKA